MRYLRCIAAVLLALACSIPAPSQTLPVIRIGMGKIDASAGAYYAEQMGFFKKSGVKADITLFRSGEPIITGVASGAIDIGSTTITNLAREISRGTPLVMIAGGGLYSPHDVAEALCVARNSPARLPADFVGKTIAVAAIGNESQLVTLAWLDQNHVDTAKIHFIALRYSDMAAAIQSGIADAAVLAEPSLSPAIRTGGIRIFAKPFDVIAPRYLTGAWFTTNKWYSQHPDLVRRFAKSIYESATWANSHQEQRAKLLSQISGIDIQTMLPIIWTPFATSLDPALVQPLLDLAFKYHTSDRELNANSIVAKADR